METGVEYKTTTLTTVYDYDSAEQKLTDFGYLEMNTKVQFSEIITIGAAEYGKISNSASYKDRAHGSKRNATGKYIGSAVTKVSNGYEQVSVTQKNGSTKVISAVSVYPIQTYKTSQKVSVYDGPGVSDYTKVSERAAGSIIGVYATTVSDTGATWAAIDTTRKKWVQLRTTSGSILYYFTAQGDTANTANDANANPDPTIDTNAQSMADLNAMVAETATMAANMSMQGMDLEGLHNMQYVIGIPPNITRTADKQYMKSASPSNNFGRCYTEMYMMSNTIFSIQPLKVKYLPGFKQEDRGYFYNAIASKVGNLGDDSGIESQLSGQLFEGQPDYNDYINTVNMLARVMAVYLGIGDKVAKGSTKYRDMDYSFYKMRDNSKSSSGTKGLFGVISDSFRWAADKLFTSAINDDTYIHFYMTADGTSMNESLSVSTKSSSLESLFSNNLSAIAQEIQFLTGAETGIDFSNAISDALGSIGDVAGNFSQTLGNLVQYGANYLRGGRLIFPQMLDDCNYDRSYSGSCRFISPSGDPEAIFWNCYLPTCYLLPYVIPQMLSDNMYKYPFLARVNAPGLFHSDLAAITNLRIQRGGPDGTMWTSDGLPFEIDVSFDITPLYSKLMVTSARHPILFLSNSALHEYLGAMCGVSFTGYAFDLKLHILETVVGNYITDTVPSMLRSYYSSNVADWLRKFFTF